MSFNRKPMLLAAIILAMALIALISCGGPVKRSLRIDPLIALRDE